MAAPKYDDAKLVVDLAQWGSQPANVRARSFVFGPDLPKSYRQFKRRYAPGSREHG